LCAEFLLIFTYYKEDNDTIAQIIGYKAVQVFLIFKETSPTFLLNIFSNVQKVVNYKTLYYFIKQNNIFKCNFTIFQLPAAAHAAYAMCNVRLIILGLGLARSTWVNI